MGKYYQKRFYKNTSMMLRRWARFNRVGSSGGIFGDKIRKVQFPQKQGVIWFHNCQLLEKDPEP
jgi:hypothetical protein